MKEIVFNRDDYPIILSNPRFIPDFSRVKDFKKGDRVGIIRSFRLLKDPDILPVIAEEDGVYKLPLYVGDMDTGKLMYTIYSIEEILASDKYQIATDEFTGEKRLEWLCVNKIIQKQNLFYELSGGIYINLKYVSGQPVFAVCFIPSIVKPSKGDTITLLFDDGDTVTLLIKSVARFVDGFNNIKEVEFELTRDLFDRLLHKNLSKLRIEFKSLYPAYVSENNFDGAISSEFSYQLFRRYMQEYLSALDELDHHWSSTPTESIIESTTEPCYVYLMVDTANGYHKIGISNHPEYREGTLQSEKPSIELVCAKKFPSRTIARAIESALHTTYQDKHLRGEWFQLDAKDIIELTETLK